MASKEKFLKARGNAEKKIYEIMNDMDPSGYNANMYRDIFKKMSNNEFMDMMEKIYKEDDYNLAMYIDSYGKGDDKPPNLDKIYKIADKHNIKLAEHVILPHRAGPDGKPLVTRDPVPILYVIVRRLQQMAIRENDIANNDSHRNMLTGQVIDHDKAATLSDVQTFMLTTTNQYDTIKEFLGPRADDNVSNEQMVSAIENNGVVHLKDLDIRTENKQSVQTSEAFLKGAGINVKFHRNEIEY